MPGNEKSGAGEPMARGGGWSAGVAGAPAWSDTAASAAATALRATGRRLIRNILAVLSGGSKWSVHGVIRRNVQWIEERSPSGPSLPRMPSPWPTCTPRAGAMPIAACSATSTSTVISPRNAGRSGRARLGDSVDANYGFIAEAETGPVGFVYMLGGVDATWGTLIDNLHVLPGQKGRGIGRRLLEAAADETQRRFPDDGSTCSCSRRMPPRGASTPASAAAKSSAPRSNRPAADRRCTGASCGTTRSDCWRPFDPRQSRSVFRRLDHDRG